VKSIDQEKIHSLLQVDTAGRNVPAQTASVVDCLNKTHYESKSLFGFVLAVIPLLIYHSCRPQSFDFATGKDIRRSRLATSVRSFGSISLSTSAEAMTGRRK